METLNNMDENSIVKIPPPPSETDQNHLPSMMMMMDKNSQIMDNNNTATLSTKLSRDRLICKTPLESTTGSIKSMTEKKLLTSNRILMALGTLQFIFGFLMVLFGIYVIAFKASLSHIGGGIWGGIFVMITGISGTLVAAKEICPFKYSAQKAAHTTFLALSLISIAISQLIVVITSTGLARDINSVDFREAMTKIENMTLYEKVTGEITQNYKGILFSVFLIIVSSLECITAIVASYKSSRELCPCFKTTEDYYQENLNIHRSHALVSSWLMEKHGSAAAAAAAAAPQIYVVAGAPSSLGRGSKLSATMPVPVPVYAIPASMMHHHHQQSFLPSGYSLIPGPLGPSSIPSPIISSPPSRKFMDMHKYYKSKSRSKSRSREPTPKSCSRSKSKSKERQLTEEDVARTYTGLDRTMAEEFIDICEMKNSSSLCSESTNSCNCQSPSCSSNTDHSNSDANSQDCLVNNK